MFSFFYIQYFLMIFDHHFVPFEQRVHLYRRRRTTVPSVRMRRKLTTFSNMQFLSNFRK